ncbi:MAG: DUF2946 family protein [Limnobacter sp.]|nr:DUF2946 family protein [Limnobacter sp.]
MDDLVEKALAKWPNVPSLAGWLKLTMQGDWLLTRPEQEGPHDDEPSEDGLAAGLPAGLPITHSRILNFIARNYTCEPDGRYYFQNGPQKAYVTLDYTPWVYRLYPLEDGSLVLLSHTGLVLLPTAMWMDSDGKVLIQTQVGVGVLHSSDMEIFSTGLATVNDQAGAEHFVHETSWTVPEHPEKDLPAQRIGLRRLKTSSDSGTFGLKLGLSKIETARVPAYFAFVTNPEVKL